MKYKMRTLLLSVISMVSFGASAGVIFNWQQTGAVSASLFDSFRPFAVEVSDEVYALAQFNRVTFGQYAVVFNQSPEPAMDQNKRFVVNGLSADTSFSARLRLPNGSVTTVNNNLTACNGMFLGKCVVTFSSIAVNPNATFRDFFNWGAAANLGGGIDGNAFSSFTLVGDDLSAYAGYTILSGGGIGTRTSINGTEFFGGADGGGMTRGSGRWVLDRSSVNNVPEPASASIALLGIALMSWLNRRKLGMCTSLTH